ncbi:hypothetical protein OHA21_23175 [Actinoplanes sp. NBC_00393]|uniref:hypothetical protein n=1 Tax=Actinoplanes sp. NBC_00393 TaxID=2975953 RepID=UPI002E20C759
MGQHNPVRPAAPEPGPQGTAQQGMEPQGMGQGRGPQGAQGSTAGEGPLMDEDAPSGLPARGPAVVRPEALAAPDVLNDPSSAPSGLPRRDR